MSTATAPAPAKTSSKSPSTTPADPAVLVAQAVKKVTTIATLPEITSQIITVVEDHKSTAAQLHRIVAHDPALVTRVLKVVNSAFYSLPGQIASIERAIVLLGLNAVKNIAVAASLGQMFRGTKMCDAYTAKDLWRHCISVGVVARELARKGKLPIADEAFLAGMIHDIGILVSLQTNPEALRAICDRAQKQQADATDFCAIEREVSGVDHQMLGAGLAEAWKFPRSCQLVARHHHDPQSLSDGEHSLLWLVHVADTLCAQDPKSFNLTARGQQIDPACLDRLKLSQQTIDEVRQNIPALVTASSSML